MKRIMMAGLLSGLCGLTVLAQKAFAADPSYQAAASLSYVDLDFRGRHTQVQEYDGKYYRGTTKGDHRNAFNIGELSVGGQGAYGLYDFSVKDLGTMEENGYLNVDHNSGFRISAKYQAMHHRSDMMQTGRIENGLWQAKRFVQGDFEEELMFRRSETELIFAYISPENAARSITARYWSVDKVGSRSWSSSGRPNIRFDRVDVDQTKRDFLLGFGTNIREAGALSLDIVRSQFQDYAPTLAAPVDNGTGSSNNGGILKRQEPRQVMTGGEFKFRHSVSKDLAVTGAFTGRQRENMRTHYKFNAVVGALNAAYRASEKLSLLAKFYLRAYQIDENMGYFPTAANANAALNLAVDTHQLDKTVVRGELIANFRPVEKVNLKAAYKLEVNNRRDAPTQRYQANRFWADGYLVGDSMDNSAARQDTKHLLTLGAKAELPLGIEAEASFKKLKANRPAFVSLANKMDDWNGTLTVPLPQNLSLTLLSGYLREKNSVTNYTQYSQTKTTYRAGLDWVGNNRAFFGADISYENIRNFSELYLGGGAFAQNPLGDVNGRSGSFHQSVENRLRNTVWGVHGKVVCPKGFVVTGNGSYTRSTVQTPLNYRTKAAADPQTTFVNDFTPMNVNIARGSMAVEYTPESLKDLTARVSYRVDDWVDKYDTRNDGRASVAELGLAMKF